MLKMVIFKKCKDEEAKVEVMGGIQILILL